MKIIIDDVTGPEIIALLEQHLVHMRSVSPPESTHALDFDELRKPDVTFWTVWEEGELMGCGAIKVLNAAHAEIKSMRTAENYMQKGVAKRLLQHILDQARLRSFHRLSLETGSMHEFEPARNLYASFGFVYCQPFADYVSDPNSVFMTKML